MSNPKRVKSFLGRLESTVNDKRGGVKALQGREEEHLAPYIEYKSWPGKNYMFIGHSENLEHPLVGTEIHVQRRTLMTLLFKAKGDVNYCVRLDEAMEFEGFQDVLSRFEKDILSKMPPHTLLGPAYHSSGDLLPTAFTVWRAAQNGAEPAAKKAKVLVKA